MAEQLVSQLQDQLIYVPARQLQNQINLVTGIENEVANLSSKLKEIGTLLRAVERRKLKEAAVGFWLEKLQDLAYEMDDVLDEWNTEIQKYRIEVAETITASSSTFWDKVRSFFLTYCLCCKEASLRHDIAVKIKELNNRLNQISQESEKFNFVKSMITSESQEFQRPLSTSIFDKSEVRGRENEKETIVHQLLSANDANNDIRIVSIVGTGGIGKTTLAQLVYDDNRVKEHGFQLRKWVCVSDPFDEKRIAKAILEAPEKSCPDVSELDTLVQCIEALISGKKFLLVLDDVWTEDYNKWKPIRDSLKDGAPGSRILVTTRNQKVARMMGTNDVHPLNELRDADCWDILSRKAFLGRSKNECVKFEKIGVEISKKCKGLPLAVNFLGSLLQSKDTIGEWKNVLESEIWELKEAKISLFPHIYLSYNELSPKMKRCFLYCAVFPKDFEIDVQELIRLWMAQGYLRSRGRVGELESRGYECFHNLAMRSFFQNFERDEFDEAQIVSCKMHDIVRDFAQHLVNGECLIIEDLDEAKHLSSRKVRHLRWSIYEDDVAVSARGRNAEKLRSFYSTREIDAFDLVGCMKRVRVLSLQNTKLEEVPRTVGNLIHLRFLDFSRNHGLKMLPEEICELYNLETLDISFCYKLTQLPQRIGDLLNLRHLLNLETDSLKQFPRGLEKLTSLRTLTEFKVGNGYSKFEYLRNLNQLGEYLEIKFYEVNEWDFDTATVGDKTHIQGMTFIFYGRSTNYASVTKSLQTPPNLEFLSLNYYPNSNLPSWIMSLNNMRILIVVYCDLASLPALGKLPSLEELKLDSLNGIELLGREFLGITEVSPVVGVPIFPKLKKLEIWYLKNLRIWEDLREEDENVVSAIMPCLQKLHISFCPKLEMLPHRLLRKAKSLQVLELQWRNTALDECYRRSGEGWIHVSHIPNVVIDGERQVP